jgi:hypothetical protein
LEALPKYDDSQAQKASGWISQRLPAEIVGRLKAGSQARLCVWGSATPGHVCSSGLGCAFEVHEFDWQSADYYLTLSEILRNINRTQRVALQSQFEAVSLL